MQNVLSLNLSDADWAEIDTLLNALEAKLASLRNLSPDDRRGLTRMGDKSEAFCRQALNVLSKHPEVLPGNFDLPEMQNDMAQLDQLRQRTLRLADMHQRAQDTEIALGSDLITASLEGYAFLKLSGHGAGLDALRQTMSARLRRGARPGATSPAQGSTTEASATPAN